MVNQPPVVPPPSPAQKLSPFFQREQNIIKLLMGFLAVGLFFMVLPGTLLGVWNLITISTAHSAATPPTSWIQAHGHAQLFGWIGSFVLGISFYSMPNLRKVFTFNLFEGWLALALWSVGVALRWFAGVYYFGWTVLVPTSSILEIVGASIVLVRLFQGYRQLGTLGRKLDSSGILIIGAGIGFLLTLAMNVFLCFSMPPGPVPVVPEAIDKGFLVLAIWGTVVPMIWGLTAKWMPVFMGLKATRQKWLLGAFALNELGVAAALLGQQRVSAIVLVVSALLGAFALRIFEPPANPPKTAGVTPAFPWFVRVGSSWLIIASCLLTWATSIANGAGIMGAGRHAVTVGCLATMVFAVGPRVLPSFLGREKIASIKLMLLALVLITLGCTLRVPSEVIAYQGFGTWAWAVLPISAIIELTAVLIFAANMVLTFRQEPLLAKAMRSHAEQT